MHRQPFAAVVFLSAMTLAVLADSALAAETGAPTRKRPVRTDRYGDPLPEGAVMRLGTLRFCQPIPWSLVFSPDGKVLASGGYDHRIRLWDPDTGKQLRVLEGHKDFVTGIALSADGKWLASGSQDNELSLWDFATGKIHRRFVGHEAPIERLALSPDGKVLASSCLAGTLRLWDTSTGRQIRSLPIDSGCRISAMTFTPDSKYLAFNDHFTAGIQLVEVASGKVLQTFKGHTENVRGLAFRADGKVLISGSSDRTIRAWDVASGREKGRYGDGKEEISCLALAPDGKTLTYGTHPAGRVHIWDLTTNKERCRPWKAHEWTVVSIAYSPDSKKVAMSRDVIAIHDTVTGKRLNPTAESESRIRQLAYAAGGKVLAVWREDETIELWDTAKWRKTGALKPRVGRFTALACSPDGKYLTTTEGVAKSGTLCHWDPQTGRRLGEYPQGQGWLESLSYSADSKTVAGLQMSQREHALVCWDAATGKEQGRTTIADSSVRNPCLTPNGRLFAGSTGKNAAVLWDRKTGKMLRAFGQVPWAFTPLLTFSPDGKNIATPGGSGRDGRTPVQQDLLLWETTTGRERLHLPMSNGQVSACAFSPGGRLLASAGQGGAVYLFDTWTGKRVGRFVGHRGWVRSLAFAPDGKTLASGGGDSTILLWDVSGLVPTRPLAGDLGREVIDRCWEDLVGADATRAYRAMAELTSCPDQAVHLFQDRLASDPGVSAERIARLIAQIDDDSFETREKASKELSALGRLAEGALTRALDGTPSPELKRRAKNLLAQVDKNADDPSLRRLLRVVEVLERLGTPPARRLLARMAKTATGADVAREATAALNRLDRTERGVP